MALNVANILPHIKQSSRDNLSRGVALYFQKMKTTDQYTTNRENKMPACKLDQKKEEGGGICDIQDQT
ncbi:hypothetical protein FRX31_020716 [Thalictrum thalictroides]|uniref:Uncharacterized protein n=1 Tax=Thalictrum thalictroides TaxID=46969 RepID=A0A7J6W036_THATH|nr:hypothetical protein FRX31_020716 [Thalictrum thalictroides]